jgi:hypothetical protein
MQTTVVPASRRPRTSADLDGGAVVLAVVKLVEDEHRRRHRDDGRDRDQLPGTGAEMVGMAVEDVLQPEPPGEPATRRAISASGTPRLRGPERELLGHRRANSWWLGRWNT